MVVFRFPASFVTALADQRPRIYSYVEEAEVRRLGRPVLRPLVAVEHRDAFDQRFDTGPV
jgi:hypothetical protein